MIKSRTRKALGIAFAVLAGVALAKGYVAQKKTSNPRPAAYSYSPKSDNNPDSIRGKVGTEAHGIEYVISDFKSPEINVSAKTSDSTNADFKARPSEGKANYSASTCFSNGTKLGAKVSYAGNQSSVGASASFDSWLNSVAFSYLENYGKKDKHRLAMQFGVNVFGRNYTWAPSYDFKSSSVNLGRIIRF